MGFLKTFKKLDLYREVPTDLTESTVTGACVSITCLTFVCWLFFSELLQFVQPELITSMHVDYPTSSQKSSRKFKINIDMILHNMPCAVVSVDAQDVMGSHAVDVHGKLHKTRLDDNGRVKMGPNGKKLEDVEDEADLVAEAASMRGEGCNLHGSLYVKKVPGSFHVSAHAKADLLKAFFGDKSMNVSHTINKLWFGDVDSPTDHEKYTGDFDCVVDALRGTSKYVPAGMNGVDEPVSFEYYIKLVPSKFETANGVLDNVHQYTANDNRVTGRYRLPAVYFRYDLSPILVKFTERRKSLSHFLVQVCAIVGGVVTVLGVFNAIVHSSLKAMIKNRRGHIS